MYMFPQYSWAGLTFLGVIPNHIIWDFRHLHCVTHWLQSGAYVVRLRGNWPAEVGATKSHYRCYFVSNYFIFRLLNNQCEVLLYLQFPLINVYRFWVMWMNEKEGNYSEVLLTTILVYQLLHPVLYLRNS